MYILTRLQEIESNISKKNEPWLVVYDWVLLVAFFVIFNYSDAGFGCRMNKF